MDDLQKKTDDELRGLMRASLPNQHVSSSIYHRAKQELEFRMANAAQEEKDLATTAKAVLRSIAKSKRGSDVTGKFITIEVLEHQFGQKHTPKIKEALNQLIDRDFVEEIEGYKGVFRLTPFGDDYLSDLASSIVSYSNISNSNIAHESQYVNQTVNIKELPEDIQKSIEELHAAAAKRDSSTMKKSFAYIADKAVDVAIAITLGHLKLG